MSTGAGTAHRAHYTSSVEHPLAAPPSRKPVQIRLLVLIGIAVVVWIIVIAQICDAVGAVTAFTRTHVDGLKRL